MAMGFWFTSKEGKSFGFLGVAERMEFVLFFFAGEERTKFYSSLFSAVTVTPLHCNCFEGGDSGMMALF